ncbi:hypothetical protein [Massilia sp.]
MDLHVIVPGCAPDLVARVVDGQLVIVPPAPEDQPKDDPKITEMRS